MKKKDLVSAVDALEKLLGGSKSALGQDFQRYLLKTNWAKIVGPTIAGRASPVSYTNKILYVWVSTSAWMNQLFYAKKEILKKVNKEMGPGWCRDIRFTLDHKAVTSAAELKPDQPESLESSSPNGDVDPQRDRSRRS